MKGCPDHRESLWLDVYGELDPERSSEWREHLSRCGDCRQEKENLHRMLGKFREILPSSQLSSREAVAIQRGILQGLPERGVDGKKPWTVSRVRWVSGLVAASLTLAFGWFGTGLFREDSSNDLNSQREVIVRNMELLKNLDVLEEMDAVQKLIQVVDGREII
jgi:anti-sigma factor RsiW